MLVHLDYVWVDGFEHPSIRSKTKVCNLAEDETGNVNLSVDEWNFDGSSTNQAPTGDSERILKPVRLYQIADNHFAALCEVCRPDDDRTPHTSNHRARLREALEQSAGELEIWLGFEQEFFLTSENSNVFWPEGGGEPIKDSRYYCSSGGSVKYRKMIREHAAFCNGVGINVVGYNAEVTPGQWEYQCFAKDPLKAADDLWMSRYLFELMCEDIELGVDWRPKPHPGWNGSGCHTNFSTKDMRELGDKIVYDDILRKMESLHNESISEYGEGNDLRLTGGFETASHKSFSHGVASRGTSVRIPNATVDAGWKGYLEDRRPSSGCDPYRVALQICKFVT